MLDDLRKEGEEETNWNGFMGHALSWLCREPEALPYIEKALALAKQGQYSQALGAGMDSWEYLLLTTKGVAKKRAASAIYYQKRLQNRKQLMSNQSPFVGFDLANFWCDGNFADETYLCTPPTDALIDELEKDLGYKLPASYIWLMRYRNGGMPRSNCLLIDEEAGEWTEEYTCIDGILAISREKPSSLGGADGYALITGDWGYPKIGVPICRCDGDHGVIFPDYTHCGPGGEPCVVLVEDTEKLVIYLADDFESFICGLCNCPEDEYAE